MAERTVFSRQTWLMPAVMERSVSGPVVLAGLDAGEAVVLHPPAGLRDGQLLKVIP